MRITPAFAIAACTLFACTPEAPPRAPATMTAADETVVSAPLAPPRAADAGTATRPEGPPAPARRCRVTATNTEGCGSSDVETLIEPVRPRIEHCRAGSGGKLEVRVRKAPGGKLAFDLQPGSSLNPTEKQCVLAALSTLDVNESSTAWAGGTSLPPTGFTSLITIEW